MTEKYRITVKTEKELMASAKDLPTCEDGQWYLELDGGFFYENMAEFCGKTLVVETSPLDYAYFFKLFLGGKVRFTRDMLSCEPELIEDEVGIWVQSYAYGESFYNYVWLYEDQSKDFHSKTEDPLFPAKPTFISMKDLAKMLQPKTMPSVDVPLPEKDTATKTVQKHVVVSWDEKEGYTAQVVTPIGAKVAGGYFDFAGRGVVECTVPVDDNPL